MSENPRRGRQARNFTTKVPKILDLKSSSKQIFVGCPWLIDKFVKSKPQKHRNLLFSCFVDFRKAFDCIPWQKLFDKQRKEGVQGRFLEVLISIYSNDKSAVKIDNKLTQFFTCHAGVKQGCMLSPTPFNFYPSDQPKFLNSASSTDIYAKW